VAPSRRSCHSLASARHQLDRLLRHDQIRGQRRRRSILGRRLHDHVSVVFHRGRLLVAIRLGPLLVLLVLLAVRRLGLVMLRIGRLLVIRRPGLVARGGQRFGRA
jgi:hypothetical protein